MSPQLARTCNAWFVLSVSCILLAAYGVQFAAGELPCPLCLLQRLAMLGVGAGALLNVVFGVRPRYYGLSLASAIFGGTVAGRQVLLHALPGDPGYGAPLWGLHLYTWSFVAFVGVGAILSLMLVLDRQFAAGQPRRERLPLSRFAGGVLVLFLLVAAANVATTVLLCGLGPCPDNPTQYQWLGSAGP